MGYHLTIGNALPYHEKDEYGLHAGWSVQAIARDDAPTFPHDELTGNSSSRSPSYSAWREFTERVDLVSMFYDDENGLLRPHPGCAILTQQHADTIAARLAAYPRTQEPGFSGWPVFNAETKSWDTPDEGKYDPWLARLLWLDYWVRYAVANCETPAMENS